MSDQASAGSPVIEVIEGSRENVVDRCMGKVCRATEPLVGEKALKVHLFIYWMYCLYHMMKATSAQGEARKQNDGANLFVVLAIAVSIIFALLGIITRTCSFLYPLFAIILIETMRTFFLAAMCGKGTLEETIWILKSYSDGPFKEVALSLSSYLQQSINGPRDLLFYCYGAQMAYFFYFLIVIFSNILVLSLEERDLMYRRQMLERMAILQQAENPVQNGRFPYLHQLGIPLPHMPAEVVANADSPPDYSEIFREHASVMPSVPSIPTPPPRYSQLENASPDHVSMRNTNSSDSPTSTDSKLGVTTSRTKLFSSSNSSEESGQSPRSTVNTAPTQKEESRIRM